MEMNCEQFNYLGEVELMNQPKTVFFCPFDVTDSIFKFVTKWVGSLDPMEGVIVCGNSTGVERYTLRKLLNKGFAVIVPLATTIPQVLEELNLGWKLKDEESVGMLNKAFDEHRLLLVSSKQNVSVSTPSKQTLAIRNEWMREAGDRFVVALCHEFDYFDRFLLGKEVEYLMPVVSEEIPADSQASGDVASLGDSLLRAEQIRQESMRMGWDIYRIIRYQNLVTSAQQLNQLMERYFRLDIEHPSLLHSLILTAVARNFTELTDFDFLAFLRSWSIQNLRDEDWKRFKNKDGHYLPSLVERCLTRIFNQMPSHNLMSLDYEKPFNTTLVHEWLDKAMQHSPQNRLHMKKALRLAIYEHDEEKINFYQQQLAV